MKASEWIGLSQGLQSPGCPYLSREGDIIGKKAFL
jgi:hypothetical protein